MNTGKEPAMSRGEVLSAVARASARTALLVHCEMKRGLPSLASIAVTAPFVGVLGTLYGIVISFAGVAGERHAIYLALMNSLSEALIPTALGVLVATLAFGGYKCSEVRVDGFHVEMENACSELLNELARQLHPKENINRSAK